MASIYKKAMGPHQSPMALHPHIGNGLMGDPFQNKNKRSRSLKKDS
jgi:hypothetical protein